jgi:hypothetical protein
MDNVSAKSCLVIVFTMASFLASAADLSQPNPLSDSEWDKVREHVELLDKISFIPSLLPVIMKHQDTLNLSDDQRAAFRGWRKQNYKKMVDLMNEIIGQRIALSKAALDPSADSNQLISQQEAILQLQEELLRVRLSCRELVLTTFSPEQWSSLAFVLEEYPNFAGLMQ